MYLNTGFAPLPRELDLPPNPAHRRYRVARHTLAGPALESFNALRGRLDPDSRPLESDQLATAARVLCRGTGADLPECVGQRLEAALLAARAVRDRAWHSPEQVVDAMHRVADYMHSRDDLIPDTLPTIGRFDDVLIIDAAWPLLTDEVVAYRDFRSMRSWLRDEDPTRAKTFDRSAWLDLRREQAEAKRRARQALEASYLTPSRTSFRVH